MLAAKRQDGGLFKSPPYPGYPFIMIPDLTSPYLPNGSLSPTARTVSSFIFTTLMCTHTPHTHTHTRWYSPHTHTHTHTHTHLDCPSVVTQKVQPVKKKKKMQSQVLQLALKCTVQRHACPPHHLPPPLCLSWTAASMLTLLSANALLCLYGSLMCTWHVFFFFYVFYFFATFFFLIKCTRN